MCIKFEFIRIIVLLVFISTNVKAMASPTKINDSLLLTEAFTSFENENYSKALLIFNKLEKLYPDEAEYNYYLGVCQLKMNVDLDKAIDNLKIALSENVNNVVAFSLAEAYHKTFQFNLAIRYYKKFKETYKENTLGLDREIEMCKNGLSFINTYRNIVLSEAENISQEKFYNSYKLDGFSKLIINYNDTIRQQLLCSTYKGGVFYYSSTPLESDSGSELFRMVDKQKEILTVLNSKYDEQYPFMSPDGKTLFFSSKGFDSMGGYDIFKSVYNSKTDTWSKPQNMGFPINSCHDDLFFALDSTGTKASFSSNRECEKGETMNYSFKYTTKPDVRIVRGYENFVDLSKLSHLIENKENDFQLSDFEFKLNDSIIYTSLNNFKSPKAKDLFLQAKKDEYNAKLAFDEVNKLRKNLIFLGPKEEAVVSKQIVDLDGICLKLNEKVSMEFEKSKNAELLLYVKKQEPKEKLELKQESKETPSEKESPSMTELASVKSKNIEHKENRNYGDVKTNILKGIYYNIFLGEFTQAKFETLHRDLSQVMRKTNTDSNTVYYIGPFPSYEDANTFNIKIKREFEKSSVLVFKNGNQIIMPGYEHENINDHTNIVNDEKDIVNAIKANVKKEAVEDSSKYEEAVIVNNKKDSVNIEELMYKKAVPVKSQAVLLSEDANLDKTNEADSENVKVEVIGFESENVKPEEIKKEIKKIQNVEISKYPVFKVQVAVFSGKIPSFVEEKLNDFKDYKVEYLSVYNAGRTVCNVGYLASYKTATNLKIKLKTVGFKGAFTVAYLGDEQISVAKAIKLLSFN